MVTARREFSRRELLRRAAAGAAAFELTGTLVEGSGGPRRRKTLLSFYCDDITVAQYERYFGSILAEAQRIREHLGDRVVWMRPSDITDRYHKAGGWDFLRHL